MIVAGCSKEGKVGEREEVRSRRVVKWQSRRGSSSAVVPLCKLDGQLWGSATRIASAAARLIVTPFVSLTRSLYLGVSLSLALAQCHFPLASLGWVLAAFSCQLSHLGHSPGI